MTDLKCKAAFEFRIYNVLKLAGDVYSPPFATSNEMFWQLVFNPSTPDHPQFCSLGLRAIPNPEEENTTGIWKTREMYGATIFLKDPKTNKKIDVGKAELNGFSATRRGFGWKDFCHSSELPIHGELIFGVDFEVADVGTVAHSVTLPGRPAAKDLADAWGEQLNNPETADVQFNVKGRIIYANSGILSRRSEYFRKMFEGVWAETKKFKKPPNRQVPTRHTRDSSDSTVTSTSSSEKTKSRANSISGELTSGNAAQSERQFRYMIDISDFFHQTFLEMLRFLYTDQVTFSKRKDSHQTAFDLFAIADKYIVTELRERAKVKIFHELNPNNAAEILFSSAWKWPDIKEFVMKYVVDNFPRIRKTGGFKKVEGNPRSYPMSSEILVELLSFLVPCDNEKNSRTMEVTIVKPDHDMN
ncbi:hypothetical protein G9A89_016839 [Geosiphon pyriformis]|nr:hypothetical protein G9A89_016839 [Geosiphon pyriformis]